MIDTGADRTSLPGPYAPLLGYQPAELQVGNGRQVQGTFTTWEATVALEANLHGLPQPVFELQPVFVPGSLDVLWGRLDFLRHWSVTISESEQRFVIQQA